MLIPQDENAFSDAHRTPRQSKPDPAIIRSLFLFSHNTSVGGGHLYRHNLSGYGSMRPSAAHAYGASAMRWELGLEVQIITEHSQSAPPGGNGFQAI